MQKYGMVDPRLQTLRLVAQHGTITAAAAASHYTPSAVSAQLRSLAQEVGVSLLERQGRGVRLTDAAMVLLEYADEVAGRWEQTRARVHSLEGPRAGTLTLCGFSTAAASLLPQAARSVTERHPGTVVRIIEADPGDCFDLLLSGRADVAVIVATAEMPPVNDSRFEQLALGQDPFDLLVPAEHPFAGRASIRLAEAANEAWIMDRPGRPYQRLVAGACLAAGFSPQIAHEAVEWETGAALVHAGLGVALIPQLANLPNGYDVARVPLRGDPRPARHLRTAIRSESAAYPRIATALEVMADSSALMLPES